MLLIFGLNSSGLHFALAQVGINLGEIMEIVIDDGVDITEVEVVVTHYNLRKGRGQRPEFEAAVKGRRVEFDAPHRTDCFLLMSSTADNLEQEIKLLPDIEKLDS